MVAKSNKAKNNTEQKRKIKKKLPGKISNPAIRRLARKSGIKRVSVKIYEYVKELTNTFLNQIIKDACLYIEYRKKKKITVEDVVRSLKRQGRSLYGYNY